MKTDAKNVKQRLKLWLLSGKTITHNQAQKMWGTNRLSEFIRRLRHDDNMNISMKMVYEEAYQNLQAEATRPEE